MARDPAKRHVIDESETPPVELEIDPALVEFIILKARAFDVKDALTDDDDGSNAVDDNDLGVLEDDPYDLTETELRDALAGLGEQEAIDLLTIFWIGRGDFSAADWKEARALATERIRGDVSAYLMGDPGLGDYLEEGLSQIGYHPEDFGP